MGIDISKLTGELKFLARLSDKNENNIIDDENEYSIFKGHADVELKAGNISEEEYKKIFGLESSASKPVETVKTASTVVTKPVTLSKKDEKRNRNAVKDSVEELVKNGTAPKDLIAQLRKEYQNPEYNKYINEVESMLNMIPAYNSKEDVEKIHDSVKEQLKSADKWDGFHKDILGYLEEQAETAQIEKEYEGLVRRYSDIKKTMAGTELVKQQGDNFKAYVEILKDELQTKGADGKKEWNKSYTKEAFDYLEEYAKQDAKDVVESRLEDTTGTSSRKIKKELKLQNKGKDDYQSDAIGDIKTERKIFARKNQVEKTAIDLENINREDLRKELGKELFEKLNRKYLGTVMNENGTYNLSKLSDEILTRVGADYKVNQSKDKEMAELTNIERHLEAIMNTDLTEKEVKKLIKLCDYKIEGKNRMPKVLDAIAGGIGGAVSAFSSSPVINVYDRTALNLTLDAQATNVDDIINQFAESGIKFDVTKLTNNQIKISIEDITEISRDNRMLDTLRGLGIGVLTSAIFDMVFGETRDEKSCMSISDYDINDERYTNADKYKEYVGQIYSKSPEKVEALGLLVDEYQRLYGDEWHAHFQQALRDMAGIGSKLNPEECRMMKFHKPEAPQTQPVQEPQQQQPQVQGPQEPQQPEEEIVVQQAPDCDIVTKEDITMKDSNKFYWDEIINMYYSDCLATHTMKEIRFKLREVNNIQNNYTAIPANLLLPYDLFGDGSCTRTERKDLQKSKLRGSRIVKAKTLKTPQGGWRGGIDCKKTDGSSDTTWVNGYYSTKAEAEAAARDLLGE